MNETQSNASRRIGLSWLVLGFLIAITLGFGLVGWWHESACLNGWTRVENTAFLTLRAFSFDSVYTDDAKVNGDVWLIVARWSGMIVFWYSAFLGFTALASSRLALFRLGCDSSHTLVVGDHPIVEALLRAASFRDGRVVHMSRSASAASRTDHVTTVPRVDWQDALTLGRAHHAKLVVVAETDVGQSAETALRTIGWLRKEKVEDCHVAVHLDDPAAAEGFHHVGAGYVYTFCQAQASARAVLELEPPFRLARACGVKSIHLLFLGFGPLAEAILCDAMVSSVTRDLGRPWFTVIDDDPAKVETAFRDRHPEIESGGGSCEVRFLAGPIGRAIGDLTSDARKDEPAICAAYVCFDQSSLAFEAAVSLREHAQKADAFKAPIFVNMRSDAGLRSFFADQSARPLRLVGFGGVDDAVRVASVLEEDPDAAARSVHLAYNAIYNDVYGAEGKPQDWEALSEELRISNRRVITHIPAKLASLDFDLDPWLALPPEKRANPPALHPDHKLLRGEEDRRMTAELEHRRWMADRRVNGWRYANKTDRVRKYHADLVPFDRLPDKVKDFDYGVVDWLDKFLPRDKNGLKRKT